MRVTLFLRITLFGQKKQKCKECAFCLYMFCMCCTELENFGQQKFAGDFFEDLHFSELDGIV